MTEETPRTAGVIAPPPLLLLISLILGFSLSAAAPLGVLSSAPTGARYAAGGLVVLAGLVLSFYGAGRFWQKKTPVNPYYPPTLLVTDGVFGLMRNPMYVAFYVFSLGLAIAFAADWLVVTTIVLAILIHYGVVKREERFLTAKFGADYTAYCAKVRRYGVV